jgi:hypothetical protein
MIEHFKTLLRGEVGTVSLEKPGWRWFGTYCLAIVVGSSVYALPSDFGEHRCSRFSLR